LVVRPRIGWACSLLHAKLPCAPENSSSPVCGPRRRALISRGAIIYGVPAAGLNPSTRTWVSPCTWCTVTADTLAASLRWRSSFGQQLAALLLVGLAAA
jgi:hypothetical protein